MTIEFLDNCTDPAERAAREDVLRRFPMADPRIPMQVVDDLAGMDNATITIPAGAIGPDGFVRITAQIGDGNV